MIIHTFNSGLLRKVQNKRACSLTARERPLEQPTDLLEVVDHLVLQGAEEVGEQGSSAGCACIYLKNSDAHTEQQLSFFYLLGLPPHSPGSQTARSNSSGAQAGHLCVCVWGGVRRCVRVLTLLREGQSPRLHLL